MLIKFVGSSRGLIATRVESLFIFFGSVSFVFEKLTTRPREVKWDARLRGHDGRWRL
jgi:hypothetical protein